MKQVANIDGTPVYSDKSVASIRDTVIHFTDGSYADVATGEVVNKGLGSISIGSMPKGAGEETQRQETFSVSTPCELVVRGLMADVRIETHRTNKVEVNFKGMQTELDMISVCQKGNTVIVEGKNGGAGGGITIVGGDIVGGRSIISTGRGVTIRSGRSVTSIGGRVRGAVIVGGGSVVVSGRGTAIGGSETKVLIKIPVQTNVEIADVDGKVDLVDIDGWLRVSIGGAGEVRGGRVKDARLSISGSGSVSLREVTGKRLRVNISGSGKVHIGAGKVEEVDCSVSGSGKINFGGTAEDGDLEVSGSGYINVNEITNRPSRQVDGSGSIHVGNWPTEKRTDDW